MSETPVVDSDVLRDQVREKYRAVAVEPNETYHFHTGRPLAARLGTRLESGLRSEHGSNWVIMADPEGNEFCVCDGGSGG